MKNPAHRFEIPGADSGLAANAPTTPETGYMAFCEDREGKRIGLPSMN